MVIVFLEIFCSLVDILYVVCDKKPSRARAKEKPLERVGMVCIMIEEVYSGTP